MEYIDDKVVAKLLGISLGRLRNKLVAGDPLPPRIHPPGCRSRLWSADAVYEWLNQFQQQSTMDSPVVLTRERGRPRKTASTRTV